MSPLALISLGISALEYSWKAYKFFQNKVTEALKLNQEKAYEKLGSSKTSEEKKAAATALAQSRRDLLN